MREADRKTSLGFFDWLGITVPVIVSVCLAISDTRHDVNDNFARVIDELRALKVVNAIRIDADGRAVDALDSIGDNGHGRNDERTAACVYDADARPSERCASKTNLVIGSFARKRNPADVRRDPNENGNDDPGKDVFTK